MQRTTNKKEKKSVIAYGPQQITKSLIELKLKEHEKTLVEQNHRSSQMGQWKVLDASTHAKNTINPIRKIADATNVAHNPAKSPIKLHLGDPSVSGKLPPSKYAVEALHESMNSHKHDGYGPAVGELAARKAVVERYSVPEAPFTADDVILASGCSHALQMAIEGIANPGDNILIPHPGFPLYSTLCRPHGIIDRAYSLNMKDGGKIDLEHLESLIDGRTKAIIVNNPGNPTGVVFDQEHLKQIVEIAHRHRLTIVADEIYGDLVYDGAVFHPLATIEPHVPVISCDGIAKRWMVPGWRMGWLIVHNRYGVLSDVKAGMVALSQKIVGPCSLVQGALPKILKDTPEEYFEYNRNVISKNANIMMDVLKDIPGVHPIRPHGAMYMMIGIDKHLYGEDLDFTIELIKQESLTLLPGCAFSSPGFVRIVLTQGETEMTEAAMRFRTFCERQYEENGGWDSSDEGCDISTSDPELQDALSLDFRAAPVPATQTLNR